MDARLASSETPKPKATLEELQARYTRAQEEERCRREESESRLKELEKMLQDEEERKRKEEELKKREEEERKKEEEEERKKMEEELKKMEEERKRKEEERKKEGKKKPTNKKDKGKQKEVHNLRPTVNLHPTVKAPTVKAKQVRSPAVGSKRVRDSTSDSELEVMTSLDDCPVAGSSKEAGRIQKRIKMDDVPEKCTNCEDTGNDCKPRKHSKGFACQRCFKFKIKCQYNKDSSSFTEECTHLLERIAREKSTTNTILQAMLGLMIELNLMIDVDSCRKLMREILPTGSGERANEDMDLDPDHKTS